MEKYLVWYGLQLKVWMKQRSLWLSILGMLLAAFWVTEVKIPDRENVYVGIFQEEGAGAEKLIGKLKQRDSEFLFEVYDNYEAMYQELLEGKLSCAFAISSGFHERAVKMDYKGAVRCITTPYSVWGEVAKETFFAAFLEVYSSYLLQGKAKELFAQEAEEAIKMFNEKNAFYLENENGALLGIETFYLDTETAQGMADHLMEEDSGGQPEAVGQRDSAAGNPDVYPVHGVVGAFWFAIWLTAWGRNFTKNRKALLAALPYGKQWVFKELDCLAAVTPAVLAGLVIVMASSYGRGVGTEAVLAFLFLLSCMVWTWIFGRLFKNSLTFAVWLLILVVGQFLLCPVFVDLGEYFFLTRGLRWFYPLQWYLLF